MLERYLIDHCSPTLASLKTANMFSCPYESGESLEEDVRKWNLQMKDKGLYLTILRKNDKKALVYLCRPQRLEQDLHKPGVQKFLRACGYRGEHWEEALKELEQRAGAMGANAVIGVDIDYEVLGADNGMLMVTASGTAVVVD